MSSGWSDSDHDQYDADRGLLEAGYDTAARGRRAAYDLVSRLQDVDGETVEDVGRYLDGDGGGQADRESRRGRVDRYSGEAVTAGTAATIGIHLYNRRTPKSVFRALQGGHAWAGPGLDTLAHVGGIGLSLSVAAMEPDDLPLRPVRDRITRSADDGLLRYAAERVPGGGRAADRVAGFETFPDHIKPLIGVVGVAGLGGLLVREGHMQEGVATLGEAATFMDTFLSGEDDLNTYWDVAGNLGGAAAYCQWKGYLGALKDEAGERALGGAGRARTFLERDDG